MSLDAIKLIDRDLKLFTLPNLYLRLRQLLDSRHFSMAEVGKLISHDPAIAARLLRMVNSPFFGITKKIDTVTRAISMLGTQQVHDLVLSASISNSFSGISPKVVSMETFWRRSVYCGLLSRQLASECNVLDCEQVFLGGLLRDIGHLVLYQAVPELAEQAIESALASGQPLYRVERQVIGADFAQVGGALLRSWNLPESLRQMVEYHQEPLRAAEFRLFATLVHVAGRTTDGLEAPELVQFDEAAVLECGLTTADRNAAHEVAEQQTEEVVRLLFSHAAG